MNLYTILIDFSGGTYVFQSKASNEVEALISCIKNIDSSDMEDFSLHLKINLLTELKNELNIPVPMKNMENVFCVACTVDHHFFLFNIIKTASI